MHLYRLISRVRQCVQSGLIMCRAILMCNYDLLSVLPATLHSRYRFHQWVIINFIHTLNKCCITDHHHDQECIMRL